MNSCKKGKWQLFAFGTLANRNMSTLIIDTMTHFGLLAFDGGGAAEG
jgi:hypothetical protein